MAELPLNQDTIDFSLSTFAGHGGPLVGLTLLYHPDAARVGQVSPLLATRMRGAISCVGGRSAPAGIRSPEAASATLKPPP